jgi:long-chain fatty acid transport protein
MVSDYSGKEFSMKNEVFAPPYFFATYKINNSVTAGLGAFSHFGLSSKWSDDWEGRYIATTSQLQTYTVNPNLAVTPIPGITVAAGVDILWANVELQKKLNLAPLGIPLDANQKMKGDDIGTGFNLGLSADLSKDITLGMGYRSRINLDLKGTVEHSLPVSSPALSALFPNTNAHANLHLPAQAFVGVAYKGIKNLTLEAGGRWEGWSSFKELRVSLDQPVAMQSESVTPKNWKDVYSFNMGARYAINDTIAINAGYMYDGNPVPASTFDPSIPASKAHVYTVGTDIKYKDITIGLVYAYQHNVATNKANQIDDNPADGVLNPATSANGRYKTNFHEIGISLTYRF